MTPMRVMLVADDPLVRNGLAALLVDSPDCVVVGQAGLDTDIVAGTEVYRPDMLLCDLGWQAGLPTRLECLAELRDRGVYSVVLLPDAGPAAEAWQLGAQGLLMRQVETGRLVAAMRAVEQGLMVCDERIGMPPVTALETPADVDVLTPREHDVLVLLAEGLPNKIVADRLRISEHTVKFHVNAIMGKLGAQSRTEAVVLATRRGLILL